MEMIMMNRNESQPVFKRQRFLLTFMQQLKESVTSTDLQKLVFLCMKIDKLDYYDFIPYKFGPYSFQLADDIEILKKNGYLSSRSTHEGVRIKAVNELERDSMIYIAKERSNALIKRAYCEYPYYAINSEIANRLFSGEDSKFINEEKLKYIEKSEVLFTIGYEGKSIESFINTLIKNSIKVLIDVRRNPLSRKFGFSKNKLKQITETAGMNYIHLPELGIESDKRSSLESMDDYIQLFNNYKKTLNSHISDIDYIYSILCSKNRIALMCYEKNPDMCHRHVVRDYVKTRYSVKSEDL